MSTDMYLRIPDITGGSTAPGWTGALDVLAYSWGASNPGTVGSPGKANIQDLALTCYVDVATSPLTKNLLRGTLMNQAVLTVVYDTPPAGSPGKDTYKMTHVFLSSVSLGGSGGEDRLTVNYTLNFVALDFVLFGKEVAWDRSTNT